MIYKSYYIEMETDYKQKIRDNEEIEGDLWCRVYDRADTKHEMVWENSI